MSSETKNWKKQEQVKIAKDSIDGMEEVLDETEKERDRYEFPLSPQQETQYNLLRNEPVRARVVARNEMTENRLEIFVCPVMPPTGAGRPSPLQLPSDPRELKGRRFASEMSPMGRMASYPPGDVFVWKKAEFTVLESEIYDCKVTNGVPDSSNTVVRHEVLPTVTLPPLRAFLQENSSSEAVAGVVRSPTTEVGLCNPIVDKIQAEIACQSIDSVIVMLGAPGTGKTTTLAKRLRQKTYAEGLDEEETEIVDAAKVAGMRDDWVLFTPSDLLKHYLVRSLEKTVPKDAGLKITTWADYRAQLLQGPLFWIQAAGDSVKTEALTAVARRSPRQVSEAFGAFELRVLSSEVRNLCADLRHSSDESLRQWASSLSEKSAVKRVKLSEVFCEILDASDFLSACRRAIHQESLAAMKQFIDAAEASSGQFHERWVSFLQGQNAVQEATESDEATGRRPGDAELAAALAAYCRAQAKGKLVPEGVTLERVQFLQLVLPDEKAAKAAGRLLLEKAVIDQLQRLPGSWLRRSVRRWKQFRQKDCEAKKPKWFVKAKGRAAGLSALEVDHLILHHLRLLQDFLSDRRLQTRFGDKVKPEVDALCFKMVFADEFTDFSPVQLAVMQRLAHPKLRSFFASGDFNQCLAPDGIRDSKQLKDVLPTAEVRQLKKVYRQSRTLHDFAQKLLTVLGSQATDDSFVNPEFANQPEMELQPKLTEGIAGLEKEAGWVEESLSELLARCGETVPSVAVFVPDREQVTPMADRLQTLDIVKQHGLVVEGCPDGMLSRSDVRIGVYPMDCVKGLEFEAAFLTGIDELERQDRRLFGTRLYVAATRAVRFFGVSCRRLPTKLGGLRDQFCEHWIEQESAPASVPASEDVGKSAKPANAGQGLEINLTGNTGGREAPPTKPSAGTGGDLPRGPRWVQPDGQVYAVPTEPVVEAPVPCPVPQKPNPEKSGGAPTGKPLGSGEDLQQKPRGKKVRWPLVVIAVLCLIALSFKCCSSNEEEEQEQPHALPTPQVTEEKSAPNYWNSAGNHQDQFVRSEPQTAVPAGDHRGMTQSEEPNGGEDDAASTKENGLALQMNLDNSTDAYEVLLEEAVPDWRQIRGSVVFMSWLRFAYEADGDSPWAESTRRAVLTEAEEKRWSNVVISIYNDFKEQWSAYEFSLNASVPGWQSDLESAEFWRWVREEPARFQQVELWQDSLRADKMQEYLEQYRREVGRR